MACSGEGCNSIHIQNKKYNLCGECVYKKNHGGKSRQEVYNDKSIKKAVKKFNIQPLQFRTIEQQEKLKKDSINHKSLHIFKDEEKDRIEKDIVLIKQMTSELDEYYKEKLNRFLNEIHFGITPLVIKPLSPEELERFKEAWRKTKNIFFIQPSNEEFQPEIHYTQDEESLKNERNQNEAERLEKGLLINSESNKEVRVGFTAMNRFGEQSPITWQKKKKNKSIKKVSLKQAEINRLYKLACIDMDHVTEPVCTGCLKYQGGDIKLSHSHIISRDDCKRIGRIDLISDRENLTYHCLDFGENEGCHRIWENPKRRNELIDYEDNIEYIKSIDPGLYERYLVK